MSDFAEMLNELEASFSFDSGRFTSTMARAACIAYVAGLEKELNNQRQRAEAMKVIANGAHARIAKLEAALNVVISRMTRELFCAGSPIPRYIADQWHEQLLAALAAHDTPEGE